MPAARGKAQRARAPQTVAASEGAVSDVVGSILMVAITILMAGAFAILLFAYGGPQEMPTAATSITLNAGQAGWNHNDEAIWVKHNGGEALKASDVTIVYRVNSAVTTLTGAAQLGGAFADGKLTIGETWIRAVPLSATDTVAVNIVGRAGGGSDLVATATLVPGNLPTGTSCLFDTSPPVVGSWNQTPGDVSVATTGAITVLATLTDDCLGVSQTATPQLWYCITNAPPCASASMVQAAAMSHPAQSTWQGSIPQPAGNWVGNVGKTLEYELRQMSDLGSHMGTSTRSTDAVDVVSLYTYPSGHTDAVGTSQNFANAQSALDSGALANFTEATTQSSTLAGSSATAIGAATNPTNARVCDTVNYAALTAAGQGVDVTGFTAPGAATGISKITLTLTAAKSSSGGTDPVVVLSYTVSGVSGPTTQTFSLTSTTMGALATVDLTLDRSWAVADIANLHAVVTATTISGRDARIDCATFTVTYAPGVAGNYAMRERLDFTSVPAGSVGTHTLEIRYKTSTDTFNVYVWNWATGTYTSRGTLNSASLTTFSYALTANEYSSGNVRFRISDNTPTGVAAGVVQMDYARVVTT